MAANRKWNRYQAPTEKRDESGARQQAAAGSANSSSTGQSKGQSKGQPKSAKKVIPPAAKDATTATALGGVKRIRSVLAVVAVAAVVLIAVAVGRGGGSDAVADVERDTLTAEFIDRGLETARTALGGGDNAVGFRLDEYGMAVEYYDPNTSTTRTIDLNTYSDDGYTVRVRQNHYDDYNPRPFELDQVDAAALIDGVEDVLREHGDATSWRVEVEYGQREHPGKLVMTVRVNAGELVTVTTPL